MQKKESVQRTFQCCAGNHRGHREINLSALTANTTQQMSAQTESHARFCQRLSIQLNHVRLLDNYLIIGFIYFWGINELESDSNSKKGRNLFGDHSPATSFPHKGKLLANEKSFYGYHSASQRDISIPLQRSCVVQLGSFIPKNLAIKDKVCSTFYTGYCSTSFHMKTVKMFIFVTIYMTFASMI